ELGAVALLEFLARAAPAGVVAADLLVCGNRALASGDGSRARADRASGERGATAVPRAVPARGGNRVGARERLVLVREALWIRRGGRLQLLGLLRLHLDVEEMAHDLVADDRPQLLEHRVPLG